MGNMLLSYYDSLIGKFGGVKKGKLDDGIELYSWDAISDCLQEDCACYRLCDYSKIGKCRLQLNYIKGITNIIFRNFQNRLDEPTIFRVGMHLIPMYGILCRLKMEELTVGSVTHATKTGIKVHPIYKEIRETIKTIEMEWKCLGFNSVSVPQGSFDDNGRSYYDAMEDGDVEFGSPPSKKETTQSKLRKKRDKSKHVPKKYREEVEK